MSWRFCRRFLAKRLPDHLRKVIKKNTEEFKSIRSTLKELNLSTVCEEAKCPNIGECWGECSTATIIIMGDICTRSCSFCSVETNPCPPALDPEEPENIGTAVAEWGLDYVVLTTVSRDDLEDFGCDHICQTVDNVKKFSPDVLVELLCDDFQGDTDLISQVANCGVEVLAHNLETVESLQGVVRDHRCTYETSMDVLRIAKESNPQVLTKTSLILGFGETEDEVLQTLKDLREIDVDVVTFGQYLQPTKKHLNVAEYVEPEKFDEWKEIAEGMGFKYCASGPLVRSSYKAGEFYITNIINDKKGEL